MAYFNKFMAGVIKDFCDGRDGRHIQTPVQVLIGATMTLHFHRADTLSSREREVATLVTVGRSNKQIAHHLNVSEGTVRNHLYHIFRKVRVKNRTALAAMIFRQGTDHLNRAE